MVPLEIRFRGWRFAVLRSALVIASSVGFWLLVELLMSGSRPPTDPSPKMEAEDLRS